MTMQGVPQYARMSLFTLVTLLSCALPFGAIITQGEAAETFSSAKVSVHFSPKGGATETVVQEISHAKSQILVQAYSFTSAPIAKALIDASKRGVKIHAVLDKSNETQKYSAATFLFNAGIPTVSLDVISLFASSCGYNRSEIEHRAAH